MQREEREHEMALQLSAQKHEMDLGKLTHSVAAEALPASSSNCKSSSPGSVKLPNFGLRNSADTIPSEVERGPVDFLAIPSEVERDPEDFLTIPSEVERDPVDFLQFLRIKDKSAETTDPQKGSIRR